MNCPHYVCGLFYLIMDKKKLAKILSFNEENKERITSACNKFYSILGRGYAVVIPDMQALAKTLFMNEGFKILHIPMIDTEISAYLLKLNERKYIVVNTEKSPANNNFAIAHELYHILIQPNTTGDVEEVYIDTYEDNNEEMMANAFAGNILMPREDFITTAGFVRERMGLVSTVKGRYYFEMAVILGLMSYYKTTYMAVAIRCFETAVLDFKDDGLVEFVLSKNCEKELKTVFDNLAVKVGADSIMNPTREDDYCVLLQEVKEKAQKYKADGTLTEEDYIYRLMGMEEAYRSICGRKD